MTQKKSIWAVLFVMLLMVLSVNGAVAEDNALRSGDYQYQVLEDGTAEITRYSGEDSVLKIPNTLDGKTVTSIGDAAFAECSSLTSIELPDSVTSIGDEAFVACSALTNIELPDSVTSMGVNPFADCWRLKNIQVSPEQPVFAVIDGVLFNKAEKSLICYPAGKQEEAYEVPQGIQQIKSYAFYDCSALTSIELPDSVTSIGESAFCGCDSLTTIELPDSVTSIGDEAFAWCSTLTSIELPDSVTSIGGEAFSECSSLTSIELPDSVTSIGEYAFVECSSLTNIELPDSVTSMGVNPFAVCGSLKNIQVSPEQPVFAVIDGVLFNKAEKSLICYPAGKQEEAYEVPQGIQQIKSYAFYDCRALTSIELPDSVTSIGYQAFSNCHSLTSIELPDSVTSIGEYAFFGCSNLTMTVQRDSYAAQYAKDNNLNYTYPDANDWLNN